MKVTYNKENNVISLITKHPNKYTNIRFGILETHPQQIWIHTFYSENLIEYKEIIPEKIYLQLERYIFEYI